MVAAKFPQRWGKVVKVVKKLLQHIPGKFQENVATMLPQNVVRKRLHHIMETLLIHSDNL